MKYYLVKKVNQDYKVVNILRNRKELLYTLREYHSFMYYCTNGAHNYSCRTLIDIFNELESNLIKEKSQVFITRENKYI